LAFYTSYKLYYRKHLDKNRVGGILITADTREKVKDRFTFSEKRDITVKGYGETIKAYVVDMGSIK
jgi:class 3 adenylate cyclase